MPSTPSTDSSRLLERLLAALLSAIALQGLGVLAFSAAGALSWSWIFSLLIAAAFMVAVFRFWKSAPADERASVRTAWASPWPWCVVFLLLLQIAFYPPMMADSLCYRLPRIFLALQEGRIGRFTTPDFRMNVMTWGWESMAIPFASLNLLNWSRLVNLGTWMLAYQLTHSWACRHDSKPENPRLVALALTTAPVFVLQAASTANDLYAGGLILAGIWLIRRFHESPGPIPVMGSLLALILAANAKPQFLVLGLPWLLWWVFSPQKPWRQVPWWVLATACPLYTLISPLPLLALNLHVDGGLPGIEEGSSVAPWTMAIAGLIQFSVSQLQLPVFPGAESVGRILHSTLPGYDYLNQSVPKFGPGVRLLAQIDGASFGLIHALIIALGLVISRRVPGAQARWWLLAAAGSFLIAASQVVPSTIGRAFTGFGTLLFPAAAMGLALLSARPLVRWSLRFSCFGGLLYLILNPSAPLWPAGTIASVARQNGQPGVAAKIDEYLAYQLRGHTGEGILDPVPPGSRVALLLRQVTPASPLWQPDWRARRLDYVTSMDAGDFAASNYDWLLAADNAAQDSPERYAAYQETVASWHQVKTGTYRPFLRRESVVFTLYRRP